MIRNGFRERNEGNFRDEVEDMYVVGLEGRFYFYRYIRRGEKGFERVEFLKKGWEKIWKGVWLMYLWV